jgi:hypothetical protein
MKQREVPGKLHGIRKVHSIDEFHENIEILLNFFRNLPLKEIYAQIRKAVGEIAHEKINLEMKKMFRNFCNYKKSELQIYTS